MTRWIIIRTARQKEAFVARAIERMGYETFVPTICSSHRVHRLTKKRIITESVVLPRRLFAAVPVPVETDLAGIQYLDEVRRDACGTAWRVPDWEVRLFAARLAEYNADVTALTNIGRSPRKRRRWAPLEDLREIMRETERDEAA